MALQHLVSVAILLGAGFVVSADEPAQSKSKDEKPFTAPAPQPTVIEFPPIYFAPSLPRPGTREVWQYYGVDSRGRWVPRVMQSPNQNYYLYNGAPYMYGSIERGAYMPYVVD